MSNLTFQITSSDSTPSAQGQAEAPVLYPGGITGRPSIELRVAPDGSNEAFLVPSGSAPISTGISLKSKGTNYTIECRIRKKPLAFKPEEVVRQKVLNWLIDQLGYAEKFVAVEVPIVMGSSIHPKPADIVVYTDTTKSQAWIVVETKKPTRQDGIEQLKSYMNANGAAFGYWTNGSDEKYLLRTGPNDFSKPIWRLPRAGESLADVDEPLTRDQLVPVKDLYAIFKELEQEILAHQTVDTFNEIFKVVFAKLYDERVNLSGGSSVARFRIGITEDTTSVAKNVRELFSQATKKWKDVYEPSDTLSLNDYNIVQAVKALQPYHLIRSGDVLGTAFELLVNQEMKGDMGQFFTPRQVVDLMVKMIQPSLSETVCDPACGSGGFLIYSMRQAFELIEAKWDDPDDRAEQRKDYAQENLVGMDNDSRLTKVAKAYMIMENDGRSGIYYADSLDYSSWDKALKERIVARKVTAGDVGASVLVEKRQFADGVDIILTNPPFAGAIKAPTTLSQFALAFNDKGKQQASLVRAVLFLERCIDMLKPGGRMGIVLPQGIFNNVNDQPIREFVSKKCRILAVVGLHPYTFKPFTLAKTSVLFLQRWEEGEYLEDYEIFVAVSTRPGKSKLGSPQYLKDGVTLDCDMDEIAAEFQRWSKLQSFNWANIFVEP